MMRGLLLPWQDHRRRSRCGRDFMTAAGKPVRGWTVRTEQNIYGAESYN